MGDKSKTKGIVIPYNVDGSEHSLENVIPEECVVCGLKASGLPEAIGQLVRRLHDGGHVSSYEDCLEAIMERERMMSTTLEEGVDFPHARTSAARHLVSSIALCDFSGCDHRHIIVLTVAPPDVECPYMQYVGYMASRLYALENRERLLRISSREELREWILKG
ncbi:MAG: PTS sugar transporter subunit IIA [Victivallales bacterium]|nr:PTS sugar transporter subunit IIA [Victivallales bacterium]